MEKRSGICFAASVVTGCTNLKAPTQLRSECKPERFQSCPADHTSAGRRSSQEPIYRYIRKLGRRGFSAGFFTPKFCGNVARASVFGTAWYSRPELNWDQRF